MGPVRQISPDLIAFPERKQDSHKGLFGTVAVVGGASGMLGAPLLAARAALKLGAGCVHVGFIAENAPVVDVVQPELMLHAAELLLSRHVDVAVVGCGMGQCERAERLLHELLLREIALVLDADALNIIANRADMLAVLKVRQAVTILTPHPGEAARLLECAAIDVQHNRLQSAMQLAEVFNCRVVLKGAQSLCVTENRQLWQNGTGNPGMSSAGMGDVLAGMIAALLAQKLSADDALLLAVHLHGAAGDLLMQQGNMLGMTASEAISAARDLLNVWYA